MYTYNKRVYICDYCMCVCVCVCVYTKQTPTAAAENNGIVGAFETRGGTRGMPYLSLAGGGRIIKYIAKVTRRRRPRQFGAFRTAAATRLHHYPRRARSD